MLFAQVPMPLLLLSATPTGTGSHSPHDRGRSACRAGCLRHLPCSQHPCWVSKASFMMHPRGRVAMDVLTTLYSACRHRGSRGSRAGFTAAGASDNRAEHLLISQMQTPERQRAGQSSYLVASPLPNMSSPRFFSSPNPVPLFHPSPKRHGLLQSPGQHATGFESLFQSPMRGYGSELQAAAELLRFETPSRQPALESLLSPSPSRHNNRRNAPGSQGRRGRAVAFDVADWRQGSDAALGDTHHGLTAADDADFDLVKNLLQSPGPKVGWQQLAAFNC